MDMLLEEYIEAFASLIERYDRRMATVQEELQAIESTLARMVVDTGVPGSLAGETPPPGPRENQEGFDSGLEAIESSPPGPLSTFGEGEAREG